MRKFAPCRQRFNCKLKLANGKFRNCVAIILLRIEQQIECLRSFTIGALRPSIPHS